MIDTYWPPRTLWLRFGWSDNPALLRQAGEWVRGSRCGCSGERAMTCVLPRGDLPAGPLDDGGSVMSSEERARWEAKVAEVQAVMREQFGITEAAANLTPAPSTYEALARLERTGAQVTWPQRRTTRPPADSPQQTDKEGS